jgi:hypothetical protein
LSQLLNGVFYWVLTELTTLLGFCLAIVFLAHLIRHDGSVADLPLNSRLVALGPAELSSCPNVMGVSAGPEKVEPIRAALAGGLISSLIVDEETASSVLEPIEEVATALTELLDHVVALLTERAGDVLALLGKRHGDPAGGLVDLFRNQLADL